MGVLQRFKDIMSSNINALLDKAEDPSKMIDQYLREMAENQAEVKKETASVMAEEQRCKRLMDTAQGEVNKWSDYARKALQSGNEGDARAFISKKQVAETNLANAKRSWDVAHANADKMRQMYNKLTNDINELNARREMIKAKASVAKTQSKINKATSKINSDGARSKFDSMEARVDKMLDTANAEAELNLEPTDEADILASKYDSGLCDASVDDELEAMKRELGL